MRPRHILSLAFVLVLVAMGVWSFYGNVLNPHASGIPMDGMAMPGSDGSQAATDPGSGAATDPGSAAADGLADEVADGAPSGAGTDTSPIPPSLGGWRLAALVAGDEARAAVEELHGKGLGAGVEAAWVATYGPAGGGGMAAATVWISRAARADDARALFERMTAKISEGGSPFEGLRPIGRDGVEGYALEGMGQRHYYFLVGSDLYWLAVDPAAAETVLSELLATASRG